MRTTVSTKGQIVLPAAIRGEDGIRPGDQLEIDRVVDLIGAVVRTRLPTPAPAAARQQGRRQS
jgi:AbrB family looped-hinge helix DNA binding protein